MEPIKEQLSNLVGDRGTSSQSGLYLTLLCSGREVDTKLSEGLLSVLAHLSGELTGVGALHLLQPSGCCCHCGLTLGCPPSPATFCFPIYLTVYHCLPPSAFPLNSQGSTASQLHSAWVCVSLPVTSFDSLGCSQQLVK